MSATNYYNLYPISIDGNKITEDSILILSKYHPLIIYTHEFSQVDFLHKHYFHRFIPHFHVIDETNRSLQQFSHKQRHVLYKQRKDWDNNKYQISISTLSDLRDDTLWLLFSDIYVSDLLKRGRVPYNISTFPAFVNHLRNKLIITISDSSSILAFYLFSIQKLNSHDKIAVGTIKACKNSIRQLSRWSMFNVMKSLYKIDVPLISFGADEGIIDINYVPVIRDKIYWGSYIALSKDDNYYFLSPTPYNEIFRFLTFDFDNDFTLAYSKSGNWSVMDSSTLNFSKLIFSGYVC